MAWSGYWGGAVASGGNRARVQGRIYSGDPGWSSRQHALSTRSRLIVSVQRPKSLAKVVAVDGEGNGERKQGRAVGRCPKQQSPVVEAFATKNPEADTGSKKCHEILPVQRARDFRRVVLAQQRADSLVIRAGRIKVPDEVLVTFAQRLSIHPRNEVGGSIQVVAGCLADQATLDVQPPEKLRAGNRLQQADHRRDYATFLDELDLPRKNRGRVTVESNNEPALHLQSRALNALYVSDQVALQVLTLVALGQARFIWCLDADKHFIEPRFDHQPHQILIVGQINRRLGEERSAPSALLPLDQRRQQLLLKRVFVADEIVVHEEDRPAPANPAETIQLCDHLRLRLGARPMPEHRGDVAEFAIERAAPRKLHAHRSIALQVCQLP